MNTMFPSFLLVCEDRPARVPGFKVCLISVVHHWELRMCVCVKCLCAWLLENPACGRTSSVHIFQLHYIGEYYPLFKNKSTCPIWWSCGTSYHMSKVVAFWVYDEEWRLAWLSDVQILESDFIYFILFYIYIFFILFLFLTDG